MPSRPWAFYQEWNEAVFLHWKVDVQDLRSFVPAYLEIDLFNGSAWVSVVAFFMENIRPRLLPPFPPISNFYEINIRTYIKEAGKTGIYFLSMEGSKWLSCALSKAISGLPYRYSKMQIQNRSLVSQNESFKDSIYLDYEAGNIITQKSDLDLWLTERYALSQDTGKTISTFEIHHMAWPLLELQINDLKIDYKRFDKLLNNKPDGMHYSPGVQVLAWNKKTRGRLK